MKYTITAPKYLVEVSVNSGVSEEMLSHWARGRLIVDEGGGSDDRWYNFPFSSIKEARKFRTKVKKAFGEGLNGVRIFATKFEVYENHEFVE